MIFLKSKEVGKRLHINSTSVTKMARKGILPGFRVGKLWRFKIAAIEELERHWAYEQDEINTRDKSLCVWSMRF
jgi:excisionase family DNA binding protein